MTITSSIRVSSSSCPKKVAGAIAATIQQKPKVDIEIIGAGAMQQAMKGIAIARGLVAPSGYDLPTLPSFRNTVINGEEKTAMKLVIERKEI